MRIRITMSTSNNEKKKKKEKLGEESMIKA